MSSGKDKSVRVNFLERLEKYGYITAGLSFLVLGMVVFADGWIQFFRTMDKGLPHAVLGLMDELLLVVILLELFRTIINFLKRRSISLDPFLHVGIIASIRRMLSIGASMTIEENIPPEMFKRFMIDFGVHGGIILVLVFALYLYRSRPVPVEAEKG